MEPYRWVEKAFFITWGAYFAAVLFLYHRGVQIQLLWLLFILAIIIYHHAGSGGSIRIHAKLALWGVTLYLLASLISILVPNEALGGLTFPARDSTPFYATLIILSVLLAARSRRTIEHLILILLAVFGIYFGVEVVTTPWWTSLSPGTRYSGSTGVNPNMLGMTLLPLPSLCVGALWIVRSRVGRIALLACAIMFTFFLVLTQSRSNLLVLGLINIPLSILVYGRRVQWKSRLLIMVVIIVLVVPGLSYLWKNHAGPDRNSPQGIYGRIEAWQASLALAMDGPWYRTLIGHGKYKHVLPELANHYGRQSHRYQGEPVHAHNSYLQVLVESGILGLAGLLILFGSLLHGLAIANLARGQAPEISGMLLVALCTILAIAFLDYNLQSLSGKLSYAILAIAVAAIGTSFPKPDSCDQVRQAIPIERVISESD